MAKKSPVKSCILDILVIAVGIVAVNASVVSGFLVVLEGFPVADLVEMTA